jgi:hypothetical protein
MGSGHGCALDGWKNGWWMDRSRDQTQVVHVKDPKSQVTVAGKDLGSLRKKVKLAL